MGDSKIFVVINADWVFLQHRVKICDSLKSLSSNVIIIGKDTGKSTEIRRHGFDFINIDFDRKGLNFFNEISLLTKLFKIYKKERPKLVYHVTIKPVIYGALISRILNVKMVNTVCGLGYAFSSNKSFFLKKIVVCGYRLGLKSNLAHVFFENKDDQNTFFELGILKLKAKSIVVNGVGVDLSKYTPQNTLDNKEKIVVALPTRMLWDKGVREFVEAARYLKLNFKEKVEFRLYGMIDKGNPESISEDYLNEIEIKGYLKWFGFKENMINVYSESDIVVLPSYREGLPTVLAEACAMGLPIVTTDAVGCKECVEEGINGFKVKVKSIKELAKAIEKLLLDGELRLQMGKASREKAIKDFDQNAIVAEYLKVFNSILEE